jgi:hypothetical protein
MLRKMELGRGTPTMPPSLGFRRAAAVAALAAWGFLGVRIGTAIEVGLAEGLSLGSIAYRLAGYFTVLTNLLVALAMSAVAAGRWPGGARASDSALAAVTLYIVLVGVVYHLLLADFRHPTGWALVADIGLHYVEPALVLVTWLAFAPKRRLRWRDPLYWLAYPAAYGLYIQLRGALDDWYPYPFLATNALGLEQALYNILRLGGAILLLGLLLIAIGRGLSRPAADTAPN